MPYLDVFPRKFTNFERIKYYVFFAEEFAKSALEIADLDFSFQAIDEKEAHFGLLYLVFSLHNIFLM